MQLSWSESVHALSQQGEAFVVVTIIAAQGSVPRDSGTKMVVSAAQIYATIGGGHLEHHATAIARELLQESEPQQRLQHFALGASLGQCCGGQTTLLFELFPSARMPILLFGAGHVGRALVTILAELPCRVRWIDSRPNQFPQPLASNICTIHSDYPYEEVVDAPDNAYHIVMTHDHQMDFLICEAIIQREQYQYAGVIGSRAKAARFKKRLLAKGYTEQQINRIHCPIGLTTVTGKHPMEVAVSIAAELINRPQTKSQGIDRKKLTTLLAMHSGSLQ